jgi:hypothetical protein
MSTVVKSEISGEIFDFNLKWQAFRTLIVRNAEGRTGSLLACRFLLDQRQRPSNSRFITVCAVYLDQRLGLVLRADPSVVVEWYWQERAEIVGSSSRIIIRLTGSIIPIKTFHGVILSSCIFPATDPPYHGNTHVASGGNFSAVAITATSFLADGFLFGGEFLVIHFFHNWYP